MLWLGQANEPARRNLRREAQARGVKSDRLVFAEYRESAADHLARLKLADLFLDTVPYNAHATASDALSCGLPVLTCRGGAFAGRVGASLLHALGVPELVAESLSDYEARALTLAREPQALAALKAKARAQPRDPSAVRYRPLHAQSGIGLCRDCRATAARPSARRVCRARGEAARKSRQGGYPELQASTMSAAKSDRRPGSRRCRNEHPKDRPNAP